jgi:hypothetical protein
MVDNKPETFWITSVMSDLPIRQDYSASEMLLETIDGPVVEVYLSFSHIEHLNVVRLLPFGEFPIRLLDVAYKPNPSSEVFYPVADFDDEATLDWIEVNFAPVYASELRITIAQENPKQVIYHLPKNLVVGTDIFNHILREKSNKEFKSQFYDSDLADTLRRAVSAYDDAIKDLENILTIASLEKSPYTDLELNLDLLSSLGLVFNDLSDEVDNSLIIKDTVQNLVADSPIIEIKKYEYILGIREIQAVYEVYAPTCHYSSAPYLPQATLSEIQLEVDERHIVLKNSWGTYYPTSTEWTVDLGEGRTLPIHPINKVNALGYPASLDERLIFDTNTTTAYTRLGCKWNSVAALKKNGVPIAMSGYTQERQTQGIPKIKLVVTNSFFDPNSIYTVDYEVAPDSYDINVLANFKARSLDVPESYGKLGPDNDIVLQRYPYVEYEVVNRTGQFIQETGNAKWFYKPPTGNIGTGHFRVYPTILNSQGEILYSGNITGYSKAAVWGDRSGQSAVNFSTALSNTYFTDPFDYYIQVQDIKRSFQLSGVLNTSGVIFNSPPSFTLSEINQMPEMAITGILGRTGGSPSGYLTAEYVVGVGMSIGNHIFAFGESIYEPITVSVGGKLAKNITNYVTLEHPAFTLATTQDNKYQYIHAGRRLYFNQPIDTEIKVDYEWLSQWLTIHGALRCNTQINPVYVSKVNSLIVKMNCLSV